MKFLKNNKGLYGYINKQRVLEILKTIFMFACCIGIYLIGYMTLKTNKNIWTIIAILGVLPASKSAVNMIMFIRYKSIDESLYNAINEAKGKIPVIYELVFTTSERAYYIKSAACCDKTIIMYTDEKADKIKAITEHINSCINREELKGYSLKIYDNLKQYTDRLSEMDSNLDGENDNTHSRLFSLFFAVTL
ncbi:MAG: hypothetical protein Q4E51_01955 [Lachnospiraceae bacterium]|nr:hypothetical protein [Lachnospiraceae bacterium]